MEFLVDMESDNMDFFTVMLIVFSLFISYYGIYLILPCIFDCDLLLKFKEIFGKPVSSLKGKVVWITGASSGIGEQLAYVLAKAGCKLILSARRVPELEQVKKRCLQENKYLTDNDVIVYPLNMINLDSHKEALLYVIDKFGRLDVLVHNVGRSQRAQWEKIEIEVDREMFELNVLSIVSLSRLAVQYFLQIGTGHIVINSSVAGFVPLPMSPTYCATKYALHGYFESLKQEYSNIDVTMVCPGPVQTNFLAKCFTEKSGVQYGKQMKIEENKISAKRCATLMGVAIANKLDDVWIAKSDQLRLLYILYCFPNVLKWLRKQVNPKYLMKLREGNIACQN